MFWALKNSSEAPRHRDSGTLAGLPLGAEATVARITDDCSGPVRRRLLDLGLTPGARVRAEIRSPGGDPTGYRVRGAVVALRREQASQIAVDPVPAETTESGGEELP